MFCRRLVAAVGSYIVDDRFFVGFHIGISDDKVKFNRVIISNLVR